MHIVVPACTAHLRYLMFFSKVDWNIATAIPELSDYGRRLKTPWLLPKRGQLQSQNYKFQTCTSIERISMSISGRCLPESSKCSGKTLIALSDQLRGPIYRHFEVAFKSRVISPVSMMGLLILSGMIFLIPRVVPTIPQGIQYDGCYRNHICTVWFPTVFWYIEGTTPKIDLFQFLCVASRTSKF